MRVTSNISALLALLVTQSLAGPAGAAEPTKSGEVLCQDLIGEGDYKGALAACEQAYAASREPRILPLIARIQTALVHPVQAHEALVRYLSGPLEERRRKTAEAQVRYLETLITTLSITTKLEGAEIRVDDQVMDPPSLARGVPLTAGAHRLTLDAKGATFSRFVFLAAGEKTSIELPGSGFLALSCAVPQVRFFIDEQEVSANEASQGTPRSAGSHRVVFKVGTTDWPEQQVMIAPEERVSVVCARPPTAPPPPPPAAPGMNQRGFWVTGVGLSLGIATLVTAIYNGSEFDRWQTANDGLKSRNLLFDDWKSKAAENNELMESIQTRRKVTVGLGIAAGLVTAGGVALLFADSAPRQSGSSSWLRHIANGVTVNGSPGSGEIAWRGRW